MAVTTYLVKARRSGSWWALDVPALPGVFSQAKRLDLAEHEAREAIAVMLDVEPAEVDVEVEPVLPQSALHLLEEFEEARKARERAAEAEQEAMKQVARKLTESLSQRDAGRVLGVSFQRVSQLLSPAPAKRQTSAATKKTAGSGKQGRGSSTSTTKRSGHAKKATKSREHVSASK